PELTVICRGDLLGSGSAINVAAQLARMYRERGDRFVRALRGTFAIILYDNNSRTLKAWTDHFGVERLLYTEPGGSLAVATDLALLLKARRQSSTISMDAIQQYLLYTCIPTPNTIYKEISKLPPGHQLVSRPTPAVQPYWDMVYDEQR